MTLKSNNWFNVKCQKIVKIDNHNIPKPLVKLSTDQESQVFSQISQKTNTYTVNIIISESKPENILKWFKPTI